MASATVVDLPWKKTLFDPLQFVDAVYFPRAGVVSMVARMEDGSSVEVGTIGNEGVVGLCVFHGVDAIPLWCMVQIEGSAVCLTRAALYRELRAWPDLRIVLHRYSQAWENQIGRSGACNGVHTVHQRFARWLLSTQDRMASHADTIPLTHEFLAIMLGVHRPTVTLAARTLQQAGVIRYVRGRITVVDRPALEARSCGCYRAIRNHYEGLLPA